MALAFPLLAGLLAAPLLGGSWRRLGSLSLRALPLFYAALALQLAAFPVRALPWRTPDRIAIVLWLASYAVLAVGCALNLRLRGMVLIAGGMLCNVLAIVTNGGHMPALPGALRAAGLHFTKSRNSAVLPSPHLAWLVDRWAAPSWVPWANVFSVGDVLIMAGGLVLALAVCGAPRLPQLRRTVAGARPSA